MLISIKRFLDQRRKTDGDDGDLIQALRPMGHLLLGGMSTCLVQGRAADADAFRQALHLLDRQLDEPQTAVGMLSLASEAVEALETYCDHTAQYLHEGDEQMRSMMTMLTETLADISGHSEASVARLQAIEKQLEQATGLEDKYLLRTNLEECLAALRDAVTDQRSGASQTMERLEDQIGRAKQRALARSQPRRRGDSEIDLTPETLESPPASEPTSFVAVFKLQRAEHIASRFGESGRNQMLTVIGKHLKAALGPGDRILRWKGTAFLLFLNTTEGASEIKRRLADTVAAIRQEYIEVGRKTALLSIGVDWIMFPQAQYPTLEAVFSEVDAFLASVRSGATPAADG